GPARDARRRARARVGVEAESILVEQRARIRELPHGGHVEAVAAIGPCVGSEHGLGRQEVAPLPPRTARILSDVSSPLAATFEVGCTVEDAVLDGEIAPQQAAARVVELGARRVLLDADATASVLDRLTVEHAAEGSDRDADAAVALRAHAADEAPTSQVDAVIAHADDAAVAQRDVRRAGVGRDALAGSRRGAGGEQRAAGVGPEERETREIERAAVRVGTELDRRRIGVGYH